MCFLSRILSFVTETSNNKLFSFLGKTLKVCIIIEALQLLFISALEFLPYNQHFIACNFNFESGRVRNFDIDLFVFSFFCSAGRCLL